MQKMKPSKTHRNVALLESLFDQAWKATLTTIILFIFTLAGYFSYHNEQGTVEQRCARVAKAEKLTPCLKYTPVITFTSSGLLTYNINHAALERYYDPVIYQSFIVQFQRDVAVEKKQLLDHRSHVFSVIRASLKEAFKNQVPILIPLSGSDLSETQKQIFEVTLLPEVISRLETLKTEINYAAETDSVKSVLVSQLKQNISELEFLQALQEGSKMRLSQSAKNLQPQLSFMWLYHSGNGWIAELIFWALFGLYSCTLVNINKRIRLSNYEAKEFVLLFPRMLLAPTLSIVVIALLSSGYADQQSNLNNFPYFLMLAFFLGFNSESLTGIIRDTSNKILRPISLSTEKMQQAQVKTPRNKRYAIKDSADKGKPFKDTTELRAVAKTSAKSDAEDKVLKAALNSESKKPQAKGKEKS
ncbi:hypothetical protein ESZ36_20215 [Colwellia demingiae]|uniref:Uncharacterized protein n=1 Tax=Colwellia demingiae TaxID=89401 RepID=A0A5C6Q670_9GAMM|nr:hypothetical protein [Colwellia demingiae]TWX64302.1 hypothetical protein ESZ36_20215 [Colwellia demingiae]